MYRMVLVTNTGLGKSGSSIRCLWWSCVFTLIVVVVVVVIVEGEGEGEEGDGDGDGGGGGGGGMNIIQVALSHCCCRTTVQCC